MKINAKDTDALQAKLFLLLQTEHYNESLALLDGGIGGMDRSLERAYTLYRLHHEPEAADALSKVKGSDQRAGGDEVSRGALHLEAQLVRSPRSRSISAANVTCRHTVNVHTSRRLISTPSF